MRVTVTISDFDSNGLPRVAVIPNAELTEGWIKKDGDRIDIMRHFSTPGRRGEDLFTLLQVGEGPPEAIYVRRGSDDDDFHLTPRVILSIVTSDGKELICRSRHER